MVPKGPLKGDTNGCLRKGFHYQLVTLSMDACETACATEIGEALPIGRLSVCAARDWIDSIEYYKAVSFLHLCATHYPWYLTFIWCCLGL